MALELRPGNRYTDSRGVEREQAFTWREYRAGIPVGRAYAWRSPGRSRLQALTRARVELGLAADPDA